MNSHVLLTGVWWSLLGLFFAPLLFAQDYESFEPLQLFPADADAEVRSRDIPSSPPQGGPTDKALAEAQAAFDQASALYQQGRFDEAAESFKKAYAARRSPIFLYNVAAAYHMKGKKQGDIGAYDQAIEYYRRYLVADPHASDRGKVEKAVSLIESEIGRLNLATVQESLKKELALRFTNPNDPGLYQRRQRLKALFSRLTQPFAQQLFQQLGEKPTTDPLSKEFHYRLANPTIKELLGILKSVRTPNSEALQRTSMNWFDLAQEAFREGNYEGAILGYSNAYMANPNPSFLYNKGQSHYMIAKQTHDVKSYEMAIFSFERYLDTAGNPPDHAKVKATITEIRAEMQRVRGGVR